METNAYDSLTPVVTIKDIKDKWKFEDNRKAKEIMQAPMLHAYLGIGNRWVCEKKNFDKFLEVAQAVGNLKVACSMQEQDWIAFQNKKKSKSLTDADYLKILKRSAS